MKQLFIIVLTFLIISAKGQDNNSSVQDSLKADGTLKTEMKRLNIETVLIVNSQAIDYYPLWSPNSDFIACNIEGKWYKFRLTDIKLDEAKWRSQSIGILDSKGSFSILNKDEKKKFEKVSKFNSRKVTTKNGTIIELRETENMSVSLIVTKKGNSPKVLWTSGGENCHSLVLSPDNKFVAYLCELNGLFVMNIE